MTGTVDVYCDCVVGRANKYDAEHPPKDGFIRPTPLPYHFKCRGTGFKPGTPEYEAARPAPGEVAFWRKPTIEEMQMTRADATHIPAFWTEQPPCKTCGSILLSTGWCPNGHDSGEDGA